MVDQVLRGDVEEIVISHRDRLCRFAFDFIEWICTRSNTKLVVKDREICSAEQELSEDLMAIVHVFSCRHHGMRRYKSKTKGRSEGSEGSNEMSKDTDVPNSESSEDLTEMVNGC
jgi:predicted site-specific integrase-resolvase